MYTISIWIPLKPKVQNCLNTDVMIYFQIKIFQSAFLKCLTLRTKINIMHFCARYLFYETLTKEGKKIMAVSMVSHRTCKLEFSGESLYLWNVASVKAEFLTLVLKCWKFVQSHKNSTIGSIEYILSTTKGHVPY